MPFFWSCSHYVCFNLSAASRYWDNSSSMTEETSIAGSGGVLRKRKIGKKKSNNAKKKRKVFQGTGEKVKVDRKMKKLFRKRVKEYNSDDDDDDNAADKSFPNKNQGAYSEKNGYGTRKLGADKLDEESELSEGEDDDENIEVLPTVTKFAEGCRAFRIAFKSIIKKSALDDVLGPILSGQKKLVAQKLAEEESEKKLRGEAKKEKLLIGEKGHIKPSNYLDSHEKFLIGVATKGVVKLFNAVSKAQSAQKGLNPASSKDEKVIKKRRKEAFFTALGKRSASSSDTSAKVVASGEPPSWAPLRDNYMLTSCKLKDWDKMQETPEDEDVGKSSHGSSSDDD
ncbi:hypothetical protein SAY87_006584 [Trapa incisa]|uniref:RRP15-like protein n=1 Tax=Trapa incisa TaxID=236973 RepID=A0AAN7K180_9MYRT|nr:hypothetical protein SAY87_006584 [Trapa incisa]